MEPIEIELPLARYEVRNLSTNETLAFSLVGQAVEYALRRSQERRDTKFGIWGGSSKDKDFGATGGHALNGHYVTVDGAYLTQEQFNALRNRRQ